MLQPSAFTSATMRGYNGQNVPVRIVDDQISRHLFSFFRPGETYSPAVYTEQPSSKGSFWGFFAWSDVLSDRLTI